MAIRSVEFVGKAEKIKSHELSVETLVEKLSENLSNLENQKSSLQSELSLLYSELSAAKNSIDENGNPNDSLIASIENQISFTHLELFNIGNEISQVFDELQKAEKEYEEVIEEKRQTLFEVQERARITAKDASRASEMFGQWASVGDSLSQSLQKNYDALAQAATILDGSVSDIQISSGSKRNGKSVSNVGITVSTGAAAIVSSNMISSTNPNSSSLKTNQVSNTKSMRSNGIYTKSKSTSYKSSKLSSSQNSISSMNFSLKNVKEHSQIKLSTQEKHDNNKINRGNINRKRLNNSSSISEVITDIIGDKNYTTFPLSSIELKENVGRKIEKRAKNHFSSIFSKQSKLDNVYNQFHHLSSDKIDTKTHKALSEVALSLVANEFSDVLTKKQIQDNVKKIHLLSDVEIVNNYSNYNPETIENMVYASGFYDTKNGEVVIRKNSEAPFLKLMSTYIHEILHMSSDETIPFGGFKEYRNGEICNKGLDEGATELLALQILEKNGYKINNRAYGPLVDIAKKMQSIVGEDTFKNLYKKQGVKSIRKNYDSLFAKGEFDKLLDDIDKIYNIYPAENNELKMSIIEQLEDYEKRKNDSSYRFRKQNEFNGVTPPVIQKNTGTTDSNHAFEQKIRAKGYERDD